MEDFVKNAVFFATANFMHRPSNKSYFELLTKNTHSISKWLVWRCMMNPNLEAFIHTFQKLAIESNQRVSLSFLGRYLSGHGFFLHQKIDEVVVDIEIVNIINIHIKPNI